MTNLNFNAFGLTYQDIIQSFNGSVESDFATNSECGQKIIENEIKIKEGELIGSLSKSAFDYLNHLPSHAVSTVDISGSSGFYFDFAPDQSFPINAKVVSDCAELPSNCLNTCRGEDITIAYDSVLQQWYATFDTVTVADDQKIYVSYSADLTSLVLPSLKGILRNMVCCSLGHQLYSSGADTWALIEHYCENADKLIEKLENGWIPPEFNSLRLEEWVGPFRGVRYNRLNDQNPYGY